MIELDNLIRLTEDQIKRASKMVARAFQDDPLFIYYFPNADERSRKSPYLCEFLIRYGVIYGEVYATSPNLEGIAGWLPFWEAEITLERQDRSGVRELISKLGVKIVKMLISADKCISSLHKRYADFPHWNLKPFAVDPVYQGKGYGSILLRAKFAKIDEQNLPCYLFTNNEKNVPMYEHFGLEVVEEGIIPDTEVPIWAMLRKI